jgi:hypothetical protein
LKRLLLPLIGCAVILAGCGGDPKKDAAATALPPTDPGAAQPTVIRTPLPPTWTLAPTLTEPPRVTIEIDYHPPTMTTFIPPTYTPSPPPTALPPSATPEGPVVIMTARVLTDTLLAQVPAEALTYIDGPQVGFENNQMVVMLNVLRLPGDKSSARPVTIQIALTIDQGKLILSKAAAFYGDDNSPYTETLADQLVLVMQGIVDETLVTLYNQANPNQPRFFVAEVLVATTGMTVRTVTVP